MQASQLLINSASHIFELKSRWKSLAAANILPPEHPNAGPIVWMFDDLRERFTTVFAMANVKKLMRAKPSKVLFIVMDAY